jgi:hypothetical protein
MLTYADVCLALAAEADDEEEDEDVEPAYKWGTAALDMIAKNLPSKVIVPTVLQHTYADVCWRMLTYAGVC